MARATTTKRAAPKARAKAVAAAPKRKPGRPLGSTNARSSVTKASKAATKRQAAPKAAVRASAIRAPKLSKAELEIQVAKLERSVARLRDKNKELKQVAVDAQERADMVEAQRAATPEAGPAKTPRRTRRASPRAKPSPVPEQEQEESAEFADE